MRAVALLLRKDVLVLRRSPLLLGLLVAYPLVVAALVALVASYANARPRVALVDEDGLPAELVVGEERFDVEATIDRVAREVTLVRLDRAEAEQQLGSGRAVAMLVVPRGFVADLRSMVRSPELELRTTRGALSVRVAQQVQALVYELNRQLQDAYIDANIEYTRLLVEGGTAAFLGREVEVLGLDRARALLDELPPGPRLDRLREFVRTARAALGETDEALRATANPIELREQPAVGRSWVLSAQAQAYAATLTIAFVALLLAAAALAAERDEGALARLRRGLVGPGELVAAKVALAALAALVLGTGLVAAFGLAIELGDVEGGQPWARVPLVAAGLALAGTALGALGALLGALARDESEEHDRQRGQDGDERRSSRVPREIAPAAAAAADAFPFAHALRFFTSALFDTDPWGTVARETGWLALLALVYAAVARVA
ncbi:MAG TPA: ABC transporter permease, partial [Gaiellaceae bacterium]|nr:ABC transporter permease [Gaiellaceae bacterium]